MGRSPRGSGEAHRIVFPISPVVDDRVGPVLPALAVDATPPHGGMDNTPCEGPWTPDPNRKRPDDPWFEDRRLIRLLGSPLSPEPVALWLSKHPSGTNRPPSSVWVAANDPVMETAVRPRPGRDDHLLLTNDLDVAMIRADYPDPVSWKRPRPPPARCTSTSD